MRNGRTEVLSVGDEALSYLQRRAYVSELAAIPQPYQVGHFPLLAIVRWPFLALHTGGQRASYCAALPFGPR